MAKSGFPPLRNPQNSDVPTPPVSFVGCCFYLINSHPLKDVFQKTTNEFICIEDYGFDFNCPGVPISKGHYVVFNRQGAGIV